MNWKPGNWKPGKLLVLLCAVFASHLAHPQEHARATASIVGVLKGSSGAVVTVHLEPAREDPVRYYDGYEATPGPDGSFAFTEIPAGDYRITVEDDSQLSMMPPYAGSRDPQQPSGFTPIFPVDLPSGAVHLRAGEHRKGVVIELTHKLSICGHLTHDVAPRDQWGRAIGPPQIAPAAISVKYFHYNPGFRVLEHEGKVETDKDGIFRITDLAPGSYYLNVSTSPGTWFPGAFSFSMAKPIVVGSEPPVSCNSDISIPNNTGFAAALTSISIDGGESGQRYKAALLETNAEGVSYFADMATAYLDKPMAPGSTTAGVYAPAETVEAVLYDEGHVGKTIWVDAPTQRVIFDSQMVTLKPAMKAETQNVIVFKPHPMASIQGEVVLENVTRDDFCPTCPAIHVSILRDGNGEFQTVDLSKGNHFDFHHVTPGDYQLFVYTTRPETVFLKSIVADGQTSEGRRFTIAAAKFVAVTVTLSGDLAQAAGHISPDARHTEHWETEGMRPRSAVAGKVAGGAGAIYTVRLLPVLNNNSEAKLTTETGVDGSFHFDSVPPGAYLLRAHGKDDVRVDYGATAPEQDGTPLLIAAGAHLKDLTLRAPHRNSICGRVINSNGEPQSSLRVSYRTGGASIYESQQSTTNIDSAGYFRLEGLTAGDYYLAGIGPAAGDFLIPLSGDGQLSGFKPVHVDDGKDVGCGGGVPLTLLAPTDTGYFSVAGSVPAEIPARLGDRFEAELEPAQDMTQYWPQARRVDVSDDHHFHFDTIRPGEYRIKVYGLFGKKPSRALDGAVTLSASALYVEPLRHLIASQVVTVVDRNLTDLVLGLRTLLDVSGTVSIPTPAPPYGSFKTTDLAIALVPHSRNGVLTAVLTDQGNGKAAFEFGAVDPGEYELRLQPTRGFPVNSALFIQSLKLNGEEVDPLVLHLSEGAAMQLQVELGNKMASVHAHVSEEKAFAAPRVSLADWCNRGANFEVLLLPASVLNLGGDNQPEESPRFQSGWSMGDLCDGVKGWATGAFNRELENVPPGRYYALAVRNGTPIDLGVQGLGGFTMQRRTLWKELTTIGTPITLKPGDHLELNLDDKTIEVLRIVGRVGTPDEQENLHPRHAQVCCSQ